MPRLVNFAEVSRYLAQFYENSRVEYTLDRMRQVMDYLGNPQNKLRIIHVAGTSGKTSTSYYIAALLSAGGYKTGLTISPHVDKLNERVQIDGEPINEGDFCASLSEFLNGLEKCPVQPSWFEVVVAFAYWYFAKVKVDYAVVEVGLGGLKDGTNVVDRPDKICVITDIGMDHIGVLGDTLAEIAMQKAGIIGSTNTVFTFKQPDKVIEVFESVAKTKQAKLNIVAEPHIFDTSMPAYQQRNWHLAYEVYKFLQNRDNLQHLISKVLLETKTIVIPGRMDILKVDGKILIMDGAHNAQKMVAFLASFKKLYPGIKPAVLIGVKAGKEYSELIPLLKPFAARILTTSFESSQDLPIKSMPADELALAFGKTNPPVKAITSNSKAYKALISSPEDYCLVTGSFYLLGQIRNRL